jgi:hypothetical protein
VAGASQVDLVSHAGLYLCQHWPSALGTQSHHQDHESVSMDGHECPSRRNVPGSMEQGPMTPWPRRLGDLGPPTVWPCAPAVLVMATAQGS